MFNLAMLWSCSCCFYVKWLIRSLALTLRDPILHTTHWNTVSMNLAFVASRHPNWASCMSIFLDWRFLQYFIQLSIQGKTKGIRYRQRKVAEKKQKWWFKRRRQEVQSTLRGQCALRGARLHQIQSVFYVCVVFLSFLLCVSSVLARYVSILNGFSYQFRANVASVSVATLRVLAWLMHCTLDTHCSCDYICPKPKDFCSMLWLLLE